ncbi:hypothetical protein WA026_018208 [Henosepilachna vigintioctopunctata]|uniref:Cysteine dioxygenase n=1 Tax=Henosepilachna vigintioctopunctata TaxID=420089 RepID=A0AAW1VDX6_9CUCU
MEVCKRNETENTNNEVCRYKLHKNLGTSLPTIASLDDVIKELRVIFESDSVNVEYLNYVLKSYKSNPSDWKKYAKFSRLKYTRNLVDTGNGKYNLMLLCWGEGHGSGIHDHANSHCFMKVLQGAIEEVKYAWPSASTEDKELQEIGRTRVEVDDTCYINNSIGLHRVENVSCSDTAVTLHLYCPPYNKCLVFNQRTAQTTESTVTFYSIQGKRVQENTGLDDSTEDN